ncbi:hypothetical protein HanRHA438_Chr17g0819671 [Helianthus annuus]|nr:hypothetical protein HanRHA438_Chr17g0819671 [Helianthus annuus]
MKTTSSCKNRENHSQPIIKCQPKGYCGHLPQMSNPLSLHLMYQRYLFLSLFKS